MGAFQGGSNEIRMGNFLLIIPANFGEIHFTWNTSAITMIGWDDVGDFGSLADLIAAEPNQPRILGRADLGELLKAF